MRVTNKMMSTNVVNNIQSNISKMDKTNDKLSRGTKINTPQDDPTGAVKTMSYKSNLNEIEKFTTNAVNANNFLSYTDVSLGQMGDIVQRVRELAVQASTETYEQTARDAMAVEIDELIDQVISIGNGKVGDRYIFGGFNTIEEPFKAVRGKQRLEEEGIEPDLIHSNGEVRKGINKDSIVGVDYKGDGGKLLAEVDKGIIIEYNIPGSELFINEKNNLIESMMRLRDQIYMGNTIEDNAGSGSTVNSELGKIDDALDSIMKYRSKVGARMKRIEQINQRHEDNKISVSSLLSTTQDTDITEAISQLKVQESVQRMSLSVGAKVIQPTLMDFLK
jgi:flagellar hook-associated protein 3 FlgL